MRLLKPGSKALATILLLTGLASGVLIGRFLLIPSQVQLSGGVSAGDHQVTGLVFSYQKTTPGCNAAPFVPSVCLATFSANIIRQDDGTAQCYYSVTLPNDHIYSITASYAINATSFFNMSWPGHSSTR